MPLTLPNLGLKVWNAPTDPYNSEQLAQNFYRIDEHDHSPGKGRRLSPDALADFAVTSIKLAESAVVTSKLADAGVTSRKFKPTMGHVRQTSALSLSSAGADVPGATVTITPEIPSTLYVIATFGFNLVENGDGAPGLIANGAVYLDGTIVSTSAVEYNASFSAAGTTAPSINTTAVGLWSMNLSAAAHTIKLWANRGAGTSSGSLDQFRTGFFYLLTAQ